MADRYFYKNGITQGATFESDAKYLMKMGYVEVFPNDPKVEQVEPAPSDDETITAIAKVSNASDLYAFKVDDGASQIVLDAIERRGVELAAKRKNKGGE